MASRRPIFGQARISVTNLQISPTPVGLDIKHPLAEQLSMAKAKANKPTNPNSYPGEDPIAAALKQMHDAVASEDLPADFLRLLDDIDSKIAAKKAMH
jgi:hypothetical protein